MMRMRYAKKPSWAALMFCLKRGKSGMRARYAPMVSSMSPAWQKRYFLYYSQALLSELKMRKKSFSTILCTMDRVGNLKSKEMTS